MKIIIVLTLVVLPGIMPVNAQTLEFPWLRMPQGTASLAMAGAGVLSDENLAGSSASSVSMLALSEKSFAAEAAYSLLQPLPFHRTSAGVAGKIGNVVALGAGVSFLAAKKYQKLDNGGQPTGEYTPYMLEMNFNTAFRLTGFLSLGAEISYAREAVSEEGEYNALSGDLTLAFKHKGIRASVGVNRLGASLGGGGGVKSFPGSAEIVAGYDDSLFEGRMRLEAYADANFYFNGSCSTAMGVAIGYKSFFILRGGYSYCSSEAPLPSYGTVGASFNYFGFGLDFAYVLSSDMIGNSFQIGLRYSF